MDFNEQLHTADAGGLTARQGGVWARSSLPSGIKRSKPEKFTPMIGNSVWLLATIYSVFLPLQVGTIWFYIGLPIFSLGLVILW